MTQEKDGLEIKFNGDFNRLSKIVRRCSKHVPEGNMLSFDGIKVLDYCKNCGEMYKRSPTPKEMHDWEYMTREARFY